MILNCPACKHKLTPKVVAGIQLDACEGGCGGIFFDNRELKKFDEPHEDIGAEILNLQRNPDIKINSGPRPCPVCDGFIMMRQFFSVKRKVEVDVCANCNGYWLDSGELSAIRNEFKTEDERIKAFHMMYDGIFNEAAKKSKSKK